MVNMTSDCEAAMIDKVHNWITEVSVSKVQRHVETYVTSYTKVQL